MNYFAVGLGHTYTGLLRITLEEGSDWQLALRKRLQGTEHLILMDECPDDLDEAKKYFIGEDLLIDVVQIFPDSM